FEQTGSHANRYDVTLLVNGLPLVQVELKKRGVAIREAFNQVHRYSKESFNSEHSLFRYLQLFVISNGTDTRYFANTTQRNKNSF
ncbi:type I restriction endonuclease, partial [Staphylococcus aureus]